MNFTKHGISNFATTLVRVVAVLLFVVAWLPTVQAQLNPYARQLRSNRQVIRGGMTQKPDTTAIAKPDTTKVAAATAADSLVGLAPDSLRLGPDSLALTKPKPTTDSLATDSLAADTTRLAQLSEREQRRKERRENRKPFFSDSMSLRKVCITSAVLPGFGQIYNKQYWKLPILYGTLGTSIGMWIYEDSKYKPLKRQFESITDQSMFRTEELNSLQRRMIHHNTLKQVFMVTTIASYLYFIGDAAMCYSTNDVSSVQRATTMAMITDIMTAITTAGLTASALQANQPFRINWNIFLMKLCIE